jgi:hypothetical protein
MTFKKAKSEILKRAKDVGACSDEYERAERSKNFAELLKVVTDNFSYYCDNKIIDAQLLESIGKDVCEKNDLFCNVNTNRGFLLASGSATVWASGSATVRVYGLATVRASGSATVRAYGSATVRAYDSATVRVYGSVTVLAYDSATVRAYGSATVRAYDSATAWAYDSATVRAYGSAYVNSYNTIEHKANEKSIIRYFYENRLVLGGGLK